MARIKIVDFDLPGIELSERKLKDTHVVIIRMIANNPGITYLEIAHRLGLRNSYVSSAIDAIEHYGYLFQEEQNQLSLYQVPAQDWLNLGRNCV
jgi:DNA-binding MarR family transcriptional regulator